MYHEKTFDQRKFFADQKFFHGTLDKNSPILHHVTQESILPHDGDFFHEFLKSGVIQLSLQFFNRDSCAFIHSLIHRSKSSTTYQFSFNDFSRFDHVNLLPSKTKVCRDRMIKLNMKKFEQISSCCT